MLNEEQLLKLQPKLEILQKERMIQRYTYLGMLSDYQLISANLVQPIVYTKLNPKQHFLFKRILHGLKMYKKEEIAEMHWDKKRRITKVWKRGQDTVNELKQYVCYKQIQPLFRIFANSELGKEITNSYKLQNYTKRRWLVNLFVKKAKKKAELRKILTESLVSRDAQSKLTSPWLLIRNLLF